MGLTNFVMSWKQEWKALHIKSDPFGILITSKIKTGKFFSSIDGMHLMKETER